MNYGLFRPSPGAPRVKAPSVRTHPTKGRTCLRVRLKVASFPLYGPAWTGDARAGWANAGSDSVVRACMDWSKPDLFDWSIDRKRLLAGPTQLAFSSIRSAGARLAETCSGLVWVPRTHCYVPCISRQTCLFLFFCAAYAFLLP